MEQEARPKPVEWDDDDWAIDHETARRVQQHSARGCLMCAFEDWDDA